MISVSNLVKQYQERSVVDIPSLDISRGEIVGLVGNNGAGKTTLLRMLLDLVKPTTGVVTISGENVNSGHHWKHFVGSYLDEGFLIEYLTPDEYFSFIAELHGYDDQKLKSFLTSFEALFAGEIIGTKKYIRDLSRGNSKKTGIAAAFIGKPHMILLDEPFEALDPTSQLRLSQIIVSEHHDRGTGFLISSHDLTQVTEICSRIILMEKGNVVKDLPGGAHALEELKRHFKT